METKSGPMDRKTRTKSHDAKEPRHPYENYASTEMWKTLDRAIDDLVKNRDIVETTRHVYIVGYLCKAVASSYGKQALFLRQKRRRVAKT